MDKFIWQKKNALTKEFCQQCIDKFENDNRKGAGLIGAKKIDDTVKRSTDLHISSLSNWSEEDLVFYNSVSEGINEYTSCIKKINDQINPYYAGGEVIDSGYQIQRTEPNEFYTWHTDYAIKSQSDSFTVRFLTYIWYLNDIKNDGYTEFIDGTRVQPEQGKLLLFPATWEYVHRGVAPISETKYICTGWFSTKHNKQQIF